jgi:hypothetical protein
MIGSNLVINVDKDDGNLSTSYFVFIQCSNNNVGEWSRAFHCGARWRKPETCLNKVTIAMTKLLPVPHCRSEYNFISAIGIQHSPSSIIHHPSIISSQQREAERIKAYLVAARQLR